MKTYTAVVGALALVAPPGGGSQGDLLYEEVARRWLERSGVEQPEDWHALLASHFAHVRLGVFDVRLPSSSLHDAASMQAIRSALEALVATQDRWCTWVGCARSLHSQEILEWLHGLDPKSFGKRPAEGADLARLAEADESLLTALASYSAELCAGAPLGSEHALEAVPLVLFPRRGEFVEFTCLVGLLDERLRASAWDPGVSSWLEYQPDEVAFLALEYRGPGGADTGESIAARNPRALPELVAQVACRALVRRLGAELDPGLANGLANDLVIDLYGELDTRIDGDVRSRSSQGHSSFIPGGNPNGGPLPPTSAENRWRGTKGKDHFVGVLAGVQKQSGRKASSRAARRTCFQLESLDGNRKELVTAPFLGRAARRPPEELLGDYLEFVRCYSVAFLHWLRIEGGSSPEDSALRFGEFLRAVANGSQEGDLPALVERVYAQPLSAVDSEALFESPTLEGRFLDWLAKQH